jgi:hypothetical protein
MVFLSPPSREITEDAVSLLYPTLRHLTFDVTAAYISDCQFGSSYLTSLHLVVEDGSMCSDAERSFRRPGTFLDMLPHLRHFAISGRKDYIRTDLLLLIISPVLQRESTLQSLTMRDLMLVIDISYVPPEFKGNGRIALLVVDNVKYCLADEITLSGPSEPKELDDKCKLFVELLGHADESCILLGTT